MVFKTFRNCRVFIRGFFLRYFVLFCIFSFYAIFRLAVIFQRCLLVFCGCGRRQAVSCYTIAMELHISRDCHCFKSKHADGECSGCVCFVSESCLRRSSPSTSSASAGSSSRQTGSMGDVGAAGTTPPPTHILDCTTQEMHTTQCLHGGACYVITNHLGNRDASCRCVYAPRRFLS